MLSRSSLAATCAALLLPLAIGVPATAQGTTGLPLDTELTLVAMAGEAVPDGVSVTLTLGADGSLGGHGGCNQYGADYAVEGESIMVGAIRSTLMACEEPAMTIEARYLGLLSNAGTWALSAGQLTITASDGTALIFARVDGPPSDGEAALVGSTWELIGIGGVSMPMGKVPTLVLGEDGTISGDAGCNTFSGEYRVDGDRISIGALRSTLMTCEDPMTMALWQALVQTLPFMARWRIEDGVLTLTGMVENLSLTFQAGG